MSPFGRELLLQRGSISIDSTTNIGKTPLHYAADNGRDSTVELLLQRGSTLLRSLDSTNNDGMTPLYLAAMNGRNSTVAILKAVGAIVLHHEWLSPRQIEKLQQPIPEEEIIEIRNRIYFSCSLLSQLL